MVAWLGEAIRRYEVPGRSAPEGVSGGRQKLAASSGEGARNRGFVKMGLDSFGELWGLTDTRDIGVGDRRSGGAGLDNAGVERACIAVGGVALMERCQGRRDRGDADGEEGEEFECHCWETRSCNRNMDGMC